MACPPTLYPCETTSIKRSISSVLFDILLCTLAKSHPFNGGLGGIGRVGWLCTLAKSHPFNGSNYGQGLWRVPTVPLFSINKTYSFCDLTLRLQSEPLCCTSLHHTRLHIAQPVKRLYQTAFSPFNIFSLIAIFLAPLKSAFTTPLYIVWILQTGSEQINSDCL